MIENSMNKSKKRIIIVGIVSTIFLITFILFKCQVFGMSDDLDENSEALMKLYTNYKDWFVQNDVVRGAFRYFGVGILSFVVMIADAATGLFEKSFGMMNFSNYSQVKAFLDEWDVVWGALLSVSIAWLGITLVFNSDKKPKVVTNFVVGILVVTSLTWMVGKMNTLLSKEVRNEILGTTAQETVYQMLGNNVHDLLYIDNIAGIENLGETNADGEVYAELGTPLTRDVWKSLDINEIVFPDDVKDESKIIMEYHQTMICDDKGEYQKILSENYDGVAWTDMLNTYYYRYNIDWFAAILEMLGIAVIYLFFTYKVVRTFYEIVFSEVLAILYSANVTSGQKVFKILDGIKDSYIIIMLSLVSVRLYLIATSYVSNKSWDGFSKGIILFFIALAVIDGPNIVQKLTGMDAGMSDGMQKIMSVMYGTSAAANLGKMAYGAARGIGSGVGKGISKFMSSDESTGKVAAANAAFGAGGAGSASENNDNQNDMSQDVGAQNFTENDDNNINQEDNGNLNQEGNEGSNAVNDPLNENVNADGRSGAVDDQAIANSNPDKQKADTLNGMNPMASGTDSSDYGSTAKMDQELDAKEADRSFGQDKRGVLNTGNAFKNFLSNEGSGSGGSSRSSSGSGSSRSRGGFNYGSTTPSTPPPNIVTGSGSSKAVNQMKKEVLRENDKGSDY